MAIFTRAEKAEQLAAWKAALLAVAEGQEFTIGTRRLRRADLPAIQQHLDWLDKQATVEDQAAGTGSPMFGHLIPGRY
ncbi:DUF6148 family protein [Desulfovibrio sp. JY]|nr:DUF6148 family protein [Desulfovibrio sp. JY]